MQTAYDYLDKFGPFSQKINGWVMDEAEATRTLIAAQFQAPATSISLTEDVTVGCNIVLWGMQWQPGDHILLSDCEHPGVIAIIGELQRRFQIEVSVCPLLTTLSGADAVRIIEQHLQKNTKLLVISHILWNTGQLLPLSEIVKVCDHRGSNSGKKVRVLVDAAQSVGVLPLNLPESGVDFYAFTGHKWWCGPAGLGGLYISPDNLETLDPTFIGWRNILYDGRGKPTGFKQDGRKYEIATSAYPLYAGLRQGISIHDQWGDSQQRYQRILELSRDLWEKLSELPQVRCLCPQPPESGMISFTLSATPSVSSKQRHEQLVEFLEQRMILVRGIADPNCVRACVHYFTEPREIEQLIIAIEEFLAIKA